MDDGEKDDGKLNYLRFICIIFYMEKIKVWVLFLRFVLLYGLIILFFKDF